MLSFQTPLLSCLSGVGALWSAHVCPPLTFCSALLKREGTEQKKKERKPVSLSCSHTHIRTHTSHPSQGSTNSRAPPTPPLPLLTHPQHTQPCLNSLSFLRSSFHSPDSPYNTNLLQKSLLLFFPSSKTHSFFILRFASRRAPLSPPFPPQSPNLCDTAKLLPGGRCCRETGLRVHLQGENPQEKRSINNSVQGGKKRCNEQTASVCLNVKMKCGHAHIERSCWREHQWKKTHETFV